MRNRNSIFLLVALVFVIPIAAYAAMNWYTKTFSKLPVLGPEIKLGGKKLEHTIADFSFTNQDNQAVSTASWKNKIVVADFFFTHCPSVCPAMTMNLLKVQTAFQSDDEVLINSFTVDPLRDSAAQLKRFSNRMKIDNGNWDLLTGDKKELYKLARNSFMIVATDGDGGPDDFIHSEKLVLIDKQKRIRGYYQGTSEKATEQLIHDIKKLKDEN